MEIKLNNQEYQELEDLVGIFESMYFDDEEVQCFNFIKKIVDSGDDVCDLEEDLKKIKSQLEESFYWLESLNVNIKYKDKFLSYF